MRAYQLNSPQAAGRLIALTMLADGDLSKSEFDVLDRLSISWRLDLSPDQLKGIVDELCEDLLSTQQLKWGKPCTIDPKTLATLFAEVGDHDLRSEVLRTAAAISEADGHITASESKIIVEAADQWDMPQWLPTGYRKAKLAATQPIDEAPNFDAHSAINYRGSRVRIGS